MEQQQHTKGLSSDARSKNRIRYSSARDRAKRASADVYRSYKRRIEVTTAASREERVHHPDVSPRSGKRQKIIATGRKFNGDDVGEKKVTLVTGRKITSDGDTDEEDYLASGSCFASELDLAHDRNASELFGKFYREMWPLTRSLPEMLHHADEIISILLSYLLSPESSPELSSPRGQFSRKVVYIPNLATTDILHLLAVLARDFRHEIHRHVHSTIAPRIVYDLLNPPPPPSDSDRQQLPLNVMVVEAAFRALSYVFRYDSDLLISSEKGAKRDLEPMRQYYGATLAHRRDYIRRLSAETYAPLLRRLGSDSARTKHVRRVLRALASSAVSGSGGSSNSGGPSRTVQRAKVDAIDGVALLLSQSCCGVPGRLHSKAANIIASVVACFVPKKGGKRFDKKKRKQKIEDDRTYGQEERDRRTVIRGVVSSFLSSLCNHIRDGARFDLIWIELRNSLELTMDIFDEQCGDDNPEKRKECMDSMSHLIGLVHQCIEVRGGSLLVGGSEMNRLSTVLQKVLAEETFSRIDKRVQASALDLLCSMWRAKPEHSDFATKFSSCFPILLEKGNSDDTLLDPALVLAKNLLPYLPWGVSKRSLVPALLVAAANRCPGDGALVVLHTIATARVSGAVSTEDDELFWSDHARDCEISEENRKALLAVCLIEPSSGFNTEEGMARVGYIARCLPFLSSLNSSVAYHDNDDESHFPEIKSVFSWCFSVLNFLSKPSKISKSKENDANSNRSIVGKSIVLQSLAKIISTYQAGGVEVSKTSRALKMAKTHVSELLFGYPSSIWAVKAAAAIVKCLNHVKECLNDSSNEAFELLTPNLAGKCHFLRLHSLTILNSYPRRPFVVDHDTLDFTDDLDEDVSFDRRADGSQKSAEGSLSSVSGPCDIIETLVKIESMPVSFENERRLGFEINRVEVLSRTGRLPVAYAEAVSHHMLGLFNIKFSPIWPLAIRALAAVATAQEMCAWPCLRKKLDLVMKPNPNIVQGDAKIGIADTEGRETIGGETEKLSPDAEMARHQRSCIAWDTSMGADINILTEPLLDGNGDVSRHRTTDSSTIFELTWKVLESVPHLTTRKSKVVVPIFFDFLHHQYYVFHNDDPDSRELALEKHILETSDHNLNSRYVVRPNSSILCLPQIFFISLVALMSLFTMFSCSLKWSRDDFGRKSIRQKLISFLKMLAAVNGPQQLYKHNVLKSFYFTMLSNPDASVANLALSCLMKYKLEYVTPYADKLRGLLKKDEFRDAITKFDLSTEDGTIDSHHRQDLIPVLVRILFGRFSSRGSGARSSKDSPAARRAAILSFIATLGDNHGEVDYFVYMMVRVFIPRGVDVTVATGNASEVSSLIDCVGSIDREEMAEIHSQRVEGFLNLLSNVISHLGFRVEEYVPTFMTLLLAMIEVTERMRKAGTRQNLHSLDSHNDENSWRQRVGNIRSLCFLGVSDLVVKFAEAHNFAVYGIKLWNATSKAVESLPGSVVNAVKPPTLLQLLVSLSSHPRLIPLLAQNGSAVESVFKCISASSRHLVVAVALTFVENLLTEGGLVENTEEEREKASDLLGPKLIQSHIHLLVRQFTERLDSGAGDTTISQRKEGSVTQKEIEILCRVSELLAAQPDSSDNIVILESLSSLLVPFLLFESKTDEPNKLNVLGILERIIPRISHDSAMSHLHALSKILGPNKGNPGITSLQVRQLIVTVISVIAGHGNKDDSLHRVSIALRHLCASHPKHIGEINYDEVLPVVNKLGGPPEESGGWVALARSQDDTSPKVLAPLVYSCFQMMYDEDGVLSRGALKALKSLIHATYENEYWLHFVETTVVSSIRTGLTTKHASARRGFVLLLSEVSQAFVSCNNENLYGDLSILVREDDQELDFFLNITHVQIHRRARALFRLRTLLATSKDCPFSMHSLSNVLLRLALHPVYECDTKAEENYALEGVASVGAIGKHLSWSKYQHALSMALANLSRQPEKERFLIATICALVDAFHFEVILGSGSDETLPTRDETKNGVPIQEGNAVWRALKNRLIPKLESFLVKETRERNGSVTKTLRSPIALALVKLFQKLPRHIFEARLPRLLTVTCNGLKNRDSDIRETSRETLAKISSAIDVRYLHLVIHQLSVSLSVGYQLHVRTATLHSVILAVSRVYKCPHSLSLEDARNLPFDRCVPGIMDLVQQDVFGSASEIKEADDIRSRLVKEAGGAKSHDTLELVSQCILFRPSMAASHTTDSSKEREGVPPSGVHAVVQPFLERLRNPEIGMVEMGKAKECLNRVIVGLTRNESLVAEEVLPFVYASVSPFIIGDSMLVERDEEVSEESSDEEEGLDPLSVSKTQGKSTSQSKNADETSSARREIFQWNPSSIKAAKTEKKALREKKLEKVERRKVRDGASAPKMTGSSRYDAVVAKHSSINDQAGASAVVFGLGLLHSSMKKARLDIKAERTLSMIDPYVPILTRCVRDCSDNKVVLLSLKCLGLMLKMDLPSIKPNAGELCSNTLRLLTGGGSAGDTKNEIAQSCFRTLTLLLSMSIKSRESGDQVIDSPLNEKQLRALVSLLHSALTESEQNTATFNLIKAITSRRHISEEFYDLVELILKLSVQSHNVSVRHQCRQIFLQFLIEYPLGKQRLEDHLKQMILNIKYEYEEGRLSAIGLVEALINKLPTPLMEEYAQLFYLPLVLQLVNDASKLCRESVAESIASLLKKLSIETTQILYEYVARWSREKGLEAFPLRRTSLQVYGIFVESRIDIIKRGTTATELIDTLHTCLGCDANTVGNLIEWELPYFSLACLEKLYANFNLPMNLNLGLWTSIIKSLVHPHSWVKQASSRLICSHITNLEPHVFDEETTEPKSFLVTVPGSLYEIVRNLCYQLNADEEEQVNAISLNAAKMLTWALKTMNDHPELCFKDGDTELRFSGENGGDEDEVNDRKDPILWLMKRLSGIAKLRGYRRREAVFKCFAAFASSVDPSVITPHLELMIEPLNRTLTEISSRKNSPSLRRTQQVDADEAVEIPSEVLQLLEDACGSDNFLNALASVKSKAREKREKRKQEAAAEAVHDPGTASKRKLQKQERERNRRKRRIEENRALRGAHEKKGRYID